MVEKRDWSCPHGSRWIWWPGMDGKGEWMGVAITMRTGRNGPVRVCKCLPPNSKEQEGLTARGPIPGGWDE